MFLTHLFYDALLAVAYPQSGAICGGSVEGRKFGVACEACWRKTRIFDGTEVLCWKCGLLHDEDELPVSISAEEVRCRRCEMQEFSAARAVGPHEGTLRESVLQLKRLPHVALQLEALLIAAAKREPLSLSTRIVPVPLHRKRKRSRGFNQAATIAEVLSNGLRLPLDDVSLVRVSSTD